MKKLLTIIVPIYNTQDFLTKCLDSLIVNDNLLPLLEVLLIIDGSPDNSIIIAKKYQDKYPSTFIIIDKENGGYGSVLQRGIDEANGKYCKILDSDDWYDNQALNQFLEKLITLDTDVVVTDYVREYVFENRSELLSLTKTKNNYLYNLDNEINLLDDDIFVMHRLTYKIEILRKSKINFPEKIFYTDTIFASVPIFYAKDLYYINLSLYRYFIGRDGQTITPNTIRNNRKGVKIVIKYYYQRYLQCKSKLSKNKKEYITYSLRTLIYMYYRILIHLPYKDAQKELKEWHKFIKNTEFYNDIYANKMIKYYNILPYFIFRYTSFLWNK